MAGEVPVHMGMNNQMYVKHPSPLSLWRISLTPPEPESVLLVDTDGFDLDANFNIDGLVGVEGGALGAKAGDLDGFFGAEVELAVTSKMVTGGLSAASEWLDDPWKGVIRFANGVEGEGVPYTWFVELVEDPQPTDRSQSSSHGRKHPQLTAVDEASAQCQIGPECHLYTYARSQDDRHDDCGGSFGSGKRDRHCRRHYLA
ncbi:hypothetical protein NDU88_005134 [Pleurodeles waltl]|uniref:Uncharacterized protein n=1 Tax=Pleurodeles waltl TaxID=8319 RepID=A0AAV7T9R0_PLEWA|nr:hypothetical protein NDU88_005134 [Pleurodeles waltl]